MTMIFIKFILLISKNTMNPLEYTITEKEWNDFEKKLISNTWELIHTINSSQIITARIIVGASINAFVGGMHNKIYINPNDNSWETTFLEDLNICFREVIKIWINFAVSVNIKVVYN